MRIVRKENNLEMEAVIVPFTNEREVTPLILPQRFNSTSQPSDVSIVPPELSSVSQPKPSQQTSFTG